MDKQIQLDRIKEVRNTVTSPGWALLLEDWSNDLNALEKQAVYAAKSFEEVTFARGALNVLHRLKNIEALLDAAEKSLLEPETDNSEE